MNHQVDNQKHETYLCCTVCGISKHEDRIICGPYGLMSCGRLYCCNVIHDSAKRGLRIVRYRIDKCIEMHIGDERELQERICQVMDEYDAAS